MACASSLFLLALVFLLPFLPFVVPAALHPDTCSSSDPPCQALIGYITPVNLKLSSIASYFSLDWTTIVASNDFDPSTPNLSSVVVPASKLLLLPQICGCVGSQRVVTSINYTVIKDDTLSNIASIYYRNFVTYQEIADANNISNPNLIYVGQGLSIPIPCACRNSIDQGHPAQFLTKDVQNGDELSDIAQTYNTTTTDLEEINGLQNSTLQASSIMFVPLQACRANFSDGALDVYLTVAEGSSALTYNNCVQCSCSNGSLYCAPSPPTISSSCPALNCSSSNLTLGNSSAVSGSGGCIVQSCVYMGYTNQGIQSTLSRVVDPTCPGSPPPPSFYKPPENIAASPLAAQSSTPETPSPPVTSPPPPGSSAPSPSSDASCILAGVLLSWFPTVGVTLWLTLFSGSIL